MKTVIALLLTMWLSIFVLSATEKEPPVEAAAEEPPAKEEVIVAAPLVAPEAIPVPTYDVPLPEALQLHIINTCMEYDIDPAIVISMIRYESNYNPNAVGDGGDSIGLMQIQPKWHSKRMEKLGCTDLRDPFQNVTVGVAIIAEKMASYDSAGEALTAYNAGDYGAYNHYFSKGIYANTYAKNILAYAEEINK